MTTLSQAELLEKLRSIKGATFVTIITKTDPRMVKKHRETKKPNPYYGKVYKRSRINGVANHIYGNSVNYQREREGKESDFKSDPRKWGERIKGTTLVQHDKNGKTKYYLELKVERNLGTFYINTETKDVIPTETLKPYLPIKSESSRQDLDKLVILRDFSLDSIIEITMNGEDYAIL